MKIDEQVRKCVAFVGFRTRDGSFRFAGTAFFLGRDVPGEAKATSAYLVTAKHVIDGICKKGLPEVWARLNHTDGTSKWFSTKLTDWFFHPSDNSIDVAILRAGIPYEYDHLVYPYSKCATSQLIEENEISLGDEVFIIGLFRHHHGTRKNIPIVRVGNLASMPDEKVVTKDFGEMDAIL
jgi:hypothetical protein